MTRNMTVSELSEFKEKEKELNQLLKRLKKMKPQKIKVFLSVIERRILENNANLQLMR
jgi:hypothetical protein